MTTCTTTPLELPMTAGAVLENEYPELRAMLLQFSAALDRIDRGAESETARQDPRYLKLQQGIQILLEKEDERAERVQLLFSIPV